MKRLFTLLLVLTNLTLFAQELTYEDFKTVIPFLQKEDFKGAFERTNELIKKSNNDTSDFRAQINYMNVYSSAGMVALDQMNYEEFENNIKRLVGEKFIMPGHPCVDSTAKAWNSFQFLKKDGEQQGYTMTANRTKVNILLFEYYKFGEKINPDDFVGSNVRCRGVLESFEINPNKSKIWIGRLHFSNTSLRLFKSR
jgi:hypothetical protein